MDVKYHVYLRGGDNHLDYLLTPLIQSSKFKHIQQLWQVDTNHWTFSTCSYWNWCIDARQDVVQNNEPPPPPPSLPWPQGTTLAEKLWGSKEDVVHSTNFTSTIKLDAWGQSCNSEEVAWVVQLLPHFWCSKHCYRHDLFNCVGSHHWNNSVKLKNYLRMNCFIVGL